MNEIIINKNIIEVYRKGLKGYLIARWEIHRAQRTITKLQEEIQKLKSEKEEIVSLLEQTKISVRKAS